jgi:hypothetical protein
MTSASRWQLAICLSVLTGTPVSGQAIRVVTDTVAFPVAAHPLGEPHLAIHPSKAGHLLGAAIVHDPSANLADSSRARVRCATFVSVDDGATWQHHVFDIPACFDPWVAITPDGHAVFTALGQDPERAPGGDLLIAYHSADGGQTWDSRPVSLGQGHDHPMTVVDQSDPKRASWLYVVSSLSARADNGIRRFGLSVSRSRNGGRSFDPPVFLRPNNLMVLAETPAVLSDGALMISYVEPALGDGRTLMLRRRAWLMQSRNAGFDFSAPMFVNEACGSPTSGFSLSALAADASKGAFRDRLYFGCNRTTPSTVVISSSADRGESWSVVNDVRERVDTAARQKLMAMAVNIYGVLGVVWTESVANPAGPCADAVYFGASVDGGKSFLPPERVSSRPSCADPAVNGQARAGDYFGLVADEQGRFRLMWSGVRDRLLRLHFSTITVATPPKSSR